MTGGPARAAESEAAEPAGTRPAGAASAAAASATSASATAASGAAGRHAGPGQGCRDAGARVSAIGRFLAVLEALSGRPEGSRITELARDTDLPKSTLHRTVGEMHGLGVVRRAGHRYWLSDRFAHLAGAREGGRSGRLREPALPHLLDAYEQTHEAVHLCVPRGLEAVCVDRLHGTRSSAVRLAVGQGVPVDGCAAGRVLLAYPTPAVRGMLAAARLGAERAHLTAVLAPDLAGEQAGGRDGKRDGGPVRAPGRALAWDLDAVRRRGLAMDRGGQYPGVLVAAAPVLDPRGVAIAAVSVMGAAGTAEPRLLARVAVAAARRTSAAVHGSVPFRHHPAARQ